MAGVTFCLRSPQFLTDDTDDGGGPAQDESTRLQTDCVRKRMNQVVQLADGFASQGNQAQLHRLAVEGGKDLMAKRRRIEQPLIPFFGKMPLPNIGIADIERYKGLRRQETAIRGGQRVKPKDESKLAKTRPGTVNRELAAQSHLLHKTVE
jgi:hypothetical protein